VEARAMTAVAADRRFRNPGWRRPRHPVLLAVLALVTAFAALVVVPYRGQIVSYLTHLKGAPSHTTPYVPFPEDERPELRIAVAGDVGEGGDRIDATGAAMAAISQEDPFDVLLLLGDCAYPAGDPAKLQDTVFDPFADVLAGGADLMAILGNHDTPNAVAQMEALGSPGRWWAEELGDVLLVGLDSNLVDDAEQRAWLLETLRESTATWKIVAVHHPPYSAGYQGSNEEVREAFGPFFEQNGVQLVLSGHEHDYQRSQVINGVTYVVTGAAARTRRTGEDDFTAVSFSWHSYVELGVYPDQIVGRVMNQDNRVADEWVLTP
jgi:3',5'-cyclic AMP phosphodiesterase CpdA